MGLPVEALEETIPDAGKLNNEMQPKRTVVTVKGRMAADAVIARACAQWQPGGRKVRCDMGSVGQTVTTRANQACVSLMPPARGLHRVAAPNPEQPEEEAGGTWRGRSLAAAPRQGHVGRSAAACGHTLPGALC